MTKISNAAAVPGMGLLIFLPLALWHAALEFLNFLLTVLMIAVPAGIIGLLFWAIIRWTEKTHEVKIEEYEEGKPANVIRLADYI